MRAVLPLLAVVILVSGCQQPSHLGVTPLPQASSTTAHDRFLVMEVSLRYLFDKFPDNGPSPHFSAYVLETGEFTSELVEAFRGYRPTVTASIEVVSDSGEALDKATGRPVRLWSVEVRELRGDRATAFVTWHYANLAAGGHTVQLQRQDGRWVVTSEKMDWVS